MKGAEVRLLPQERVLVCPAAHAPDRLQTSKPGHSCMHRKAGCAFGCGASYLQRLPVLGTGRRRAQAGRGTAQGVGRFAASTRLLKPNPDFYVPSLCMTAWRVDSLCVTCAARAALYVHCSVSAVPSLRIAPPCCRCAATPSYTLHASGPMSRLAICHCCACLCTAARAAYC